MYETVNIISTVSFRTSMLLIIKLNLTENFTAQRKIGFLIHFTTDSADTVELRSNHLTCTTFLTLRRSVSLKKK